MSNGIKSLVEGVLALDRRASNQGLVESSLETDIRLASSLFKQLRQARPNANSLRIGITGPPGVGKSTLIEALGKHLTASQNIAILTVDPSSPKSGGSILGDKTRMPELATNTKAFIRSSPSKGDLGGVAISSYDTLQLCERISTFHDSVGVGQSELMLADLVDIFVLLAAPGSGDELQGIKKGITELADIVLVNKCDPPLSQEARLTLFELKSAMKFKGPTSTGQPTPVFPVSAKTSDRISEAWKAITDLAAHMQKTGESRQRRERQKSAWIQKAALHHLTQRFNDYYSNDRTVHPIKNGLNSCGKMIAEAFLRSSRSKGRSS